MTPPTSAFAISPKFIITPIPIPLSLPLSASPLWWESTAYHRGEFYYLFTCTRLHTLLFTHIQTYKFSGKCTSNWITHTCAHTRVENSITSLLLDSNPLFTSCNDKDYSTSHKKQPIVHPCHRGDPNKTPEMNDTHAQSCRFERPMFGRESTVALNHAPVWFYHDWK